jgi:hypothetical protein
MTSTGGGKSHGNYVRRVSEELHLYTRTLLSENEQLRMAVEALRVENGRLADEAAATRGAWQENGTLRQRLQCVEEERDSLKEQLQQTRRSLQAHERERAQLVSRLGSIDGDNRRFLEQFVALEQQNANLANLYVASYRLHETLDEREVIAALQEILLNLVGSDEHGVFTLDEDARHLSLIASNGIQPEAYQDLSVGEGWIGQTIATGRTFIRAPGVPALVPREAALTACIPLKIGDSITGAIAVFRLLPQKPCLEDVDHEIFDLLASQAATALYCTSLHARVRGHGEGSGHPRA